MSDFTGKDLRGSRFERTDLREAHFQMADLSDATFRDCFFGRTVMRGVELMDVDIYGELQNVRINGVDVWPLISAELDRRYPDRMKMRPKNPAGFREAWVTVERLWTGTVEKARRLPPELLHESVDGEWSFIQTLRHMVFVHDSWVRRGILGESAPWHPLALPWDTMPETPGVPWDRVARPALDTVLELRRDRMAATRRVIEDQTEEFLDSHTTPPAGPGWPPEGRSFPVRECLSVVLNEEWEHRLYAERDLDVLIARG